MGKASVIPSAVEITASGNVETSFWHRLEQKWSDLRVGHQGSYSIERLASLEHYCKTTSRTRVALVCILTPLPALTTAVLLESFPLRPPAKGWQENWMFGIRLSLAVSILCFMGTSELITFLPDLNFTLRKRLIVSMGASAGFMAVYFLVASTIGFPVPYTWQTELAVSTTFEPISSLPGRVLGASCDVPILQSGLRSWYYACAAVLLPVVGLAAEHFIVKATRELEDFIPAIIAFSVDLLTVLFVSVCISASPPIHVSALFIGVDLGQLWLEFREVSAHANTVVEFIRSDERINEKRNDETALSGKLLARMVAVTRNPEAIQLAPKNSVRLWACLPHPISHDQRTQLRLLETSGILECKGKSPCKEGNRPRQQTTAIAPDNVKPEAHPASSGKSVQGKLFIVEGLQLLFQCKYLVLVEYVEYLVPLVFAIYKSILRQLPNAVYFPVAVGNLGASAVGNTLAFAALEATSLLLLHHFLQRKFAFSPFYQLAFVLETQMRMILPRSYHSTTV